MRRLLVLLLLLGSCGTVVRVHAVGPYAPEVLANLVKPSVARIMTHTAGEAEIASIKVDVRRGLIAVDESADPIKISVDEYI